jgi:hypothetical protein
VRTRSSKSQKWLEPFIGEGKDGSENGEEEVDYRGSLDKGTGRPIGVTCTGLRHLDGDPFEVEKEAGTFPSGAAQEEEKTAETGVVLDRGPALLRGAEKGKRASAVGKEPEKKGGGVGIELLYRGFLREENQAGKDAVISGALKELEKGPTLAVKSADGGSERGVTKSGDSGDNESQERGGNECQGREGNEKSDKVGNVSKERG